MSVKEKKVSHRLEEKLSFARFQLNLLVGRLSTKDGFNYEAIKLEKDLLKVPPLTITFALMYVQGVRTIVPKCLLRPSSYRAS